MRSQRGEGAITSVEMAPARKGMATSIEEIKKGGGAYAVKLLKHTRSCGEVSRRLE